MSIRSEEKEARFSVYNKWLQLDRISLRVELKIIDAFDLLMPNMVATSVNRLGYDNRKSVKSNRFRALHNIPFESKSLRRRTLRSLSKSWGRNRKRTSNFEGDRESKFKAGTCLTERLRWRQNIFKHICAILRDWLARLENPRADWRFERRVKRISKLSHSSFRIILTIFALENANKIWEFYQQKYTLLLLQPGCNDTAGFKKGLFYSQLYRYSQLQ